MGPGNPKGAERGRMRYGWFFWDLFAVILLTLLVGRSARHGFARTAISFCGFFVASILAGTLGPMLARLLYDEVIRDALLVVIGRELDGMLADGGSLAGSLADLIPKGLQGIVQDGGEEVINTFFGGDTAALAKTIVDGALSSPVLSILEGICFFAVLSLTMLLVRHVSRLFTGLYRVPVLGTLNTVFGGIIGVLEGILVLYVLAILLQIVMTVTGNELDWLNRELLDSTFIYRVFFNFS